MSEWIGEILSEGRWRKIVMKVLLIDNYDSFTYNLYQLLGSFTGTDVEVKRNDEIVIDGVVSMDPDCIILSPGPGNPANDRDFGVCSDIIETLAGQIPILGVCLGHQGIGLLSGGSIVNAERILHGKTSVIEHCGTGIFKDIPQNIRVTRYHSLIIDEVSLPANILVTAETENDEIMGIEHLDEPFVYGVQFHPESFLTEYGKEILENFLRITRNQKVLQSQVTKSVVE